MNRRGELEIAINKRTVERAIFIFVILCLVILLTTQKEQPVQDTEKISLLTQKVNEQNAQLEQLTQQLLAIQTAPEKDTQEPVQAAPQPTVSETLSGEINYEWAVQGSLLTPAQYNSEAITELEEELSVLEEELDNEDDSNDRGPLKDKIADIKREITALSEGESKYKLYNVTIAVDNGLEAAEVIDYEICWPQIDCLNVKAEGTINAPSGKSTAVTLTPSIPTLVTITKTKQVLRLTLKQNNKDIFKDDFVITS